MAIKPRSKPDDWYPQREHFQTHEQWDAHMQTLKQLYTMRDQVQKSISDLKTAQSNIGQIQKQPAPGGALNTRIGGFLLKPTTPTNGQTLKFNSATGQVEWQ